MRYQIGHQKTTDGWVIFDTVDSFKLVGMYPTEEDATLAVLKLGEQKRQQQQNSKGDRMVA